MESPKSSLIFKINTQVFKKNNITHKVLFLEDLVDERAEILQRRSPVYIMATDSEFIVSIVDHAHLAVDVDTEDTNIRTQSVLFNLFILDFDKCITLIKFFIGFSLKVFQDIFSCSESGLNRTLLWFY